eukprot:TRINITY_DN14276_c0_g1_i1.p1 TRINITY_DN14276_c0_g1~~TRINITY_DN14276_c0_g1_i1.p1  ORF type:complete len:254 (-),score=52.21 TRINITY_DN14276_c0_g1_i1:51-812(-)
MRSHWYFHIDWYLWGNFFYVVGMIGYVAADFVGAFVRMTGREAFLLYLFLAAVFVLDGLLYTMDWYSKAVRERQENANHMMWDSEFVASMMNILGALGFLLASVFYIQTSEYARIERVSNLVAMVAYVLESLFSLRAWYRTVGSEANRGCVPEDVFMWANLLNVLPSGIYLAAQVTGLVLDVRGNDPHEIFQMVRRIQVGGDILYLIDSVLYCVCWRRERREQAEQEEEGRRMFTIRLNTPVLIDGEMKEAAS